MNRECNNRVRNGQYRVWGVPKNIYNLGMIFSAFCLDTMLPKETTVTDIDLCVVIGNLIDNAVESCEKVPKEQQFIRLYIGQFKEQLYISVSNATNETVRKLDEEYITHKRGNHGHGLKRINLIVEKYDGFINRKNEAGVFVTEIMLPL